jgi:hypothetical protein
MRGPWENFGIRSRCAASAAACLVTGGLVLASATFAQDLRQPPAASQTQPAQNAKPGLFQSIGRWFDESAANFREHLRGAKQRFDDLGGEAAANQKQFNETAAEVGKNAVEVTRSAVDAVAKLPTARPMNGRERCAVAPNGAPDCVAAAETLCRRHGFSTGKSIEFTSAEECPPKAVLAAQPERAECTTVTFISKAMCQ